MLSKAKIKHIQSLRMGKFRKMHGQFVAEGSINVLDFIASKLKTIEVFATADWINRYKNKLRRLSVSEVTERELGKITALKTPSGVLAVFEPPAPSAINFEGSGSITLILEDIRDPGNLGTIIRTADWFGIRQIICSENTVDAFNPKVVQASMGSLARVELHYENLEKILSSRAEMLPVYAAVLDGKSIREIEKPEQAIIIIGSEAHGISDKLLALVDERISIPTSPDGGAESLNASIATAIICYAFSAT